ncbi:MAG TPA: DUF5682 family protein [Dyella sp.]|uniref:DUF5682 family protein n=1 Tax=Dyella sp. TaxID=1869338 RepID=UPI002F9410FB
MGDNVSLFGIRHHGPGCARSLRTALESLRPDCVLIEGPAGAEPLLTYVADVGLDPPVALLSHAVDDPALAVFHPYALYSPEWQALRWASAAGIPVQFMDVPPSLTLSWQKARRDAAATMPEIDAEQAQADTMQVSADASAETADIAIGDTPRDPLDWLARAAGYGDGETWWNLMVEERGDGEGLFEAIAEAMTVLRSQAPQRPRADQEQEDIREAHMRSTIRSARKQGYARIAVICGAWHVPALADAGAAAADARLLKGLPKLKTQTTWVPWTYRHLSAGSGYGAGVSAPGWYDYLWRNEGNHATRAVGWYARVARLLRDNEIDCSSAHLIEATRLADTLAAMRDRPAPGLDEIGEATRSVICNGDDVPMRLIADVLLVGESMGAVPPNVPTVPLQRDVEAEQKRLRLRPEALSKTLDLDLRNDNDLQRSHLLHRLALIGIEWGHIASVGASSRGTFHEIWTLAWQPTFPVELIVASRHGQTLIAAASQCASEQARTAPYLADLAKLIDRVLLANLPQAVASVVAALEARAATDADPLALLAALPALANVYRYGNVRQTDSAQVSHLFDSMLLRACIGLPLALCDLDNGPVENARTVLLGADRALSLRQGEEQTRTWQAALRKAACSDMTAPLLSGLCTRLLLDVAVLSPEQAQERLQRSLSAGAEPREAAQWLDGFLNRNAAILLHGDTVWPLIDRWLATLSDEHFLRVVPLVRRTFAAFEAGDRRDLGQRVRQPQAAAPIVANEWNEERALRALPMLRELFGIADAKVTDET